MGGGNAQPRAIAGRHIFQALCINPPLDLTYGLKRWTGYTARRLAG